MTVRIRARLRACIRARAVAACALVAAAALSACGDLARLPASSGIGAQPTLPPPRTTLIPTLHIAPARGWPASLMPKAAPGLQVEAFARDLAHPRWLLVLPNGDVLVAESNAPAKPEDGKGLFGWIQRIVMARAGAGVPSANRITLLRDSDGDGIADLRSVLLQDLNSPFGMTLVGDALYVADSDALKRFPYRSGVTRISEPGVVLTTLPAGPRNHHWTKNVIASPDGRSLYVTVGSNSNVAENGIGAEEGRAAIWQVDVATGARRIFASGLRNPNGMAFEHDTATLWTVVNERVKPQRPDLVAQAIVPDYALGAHTASLGLASAAGAALGPEFSNGMFVGQHGSWNRRPFSGYKVIFVPFQAGIPAGAPLDVLDGFLSDQGDAYGRPVGVALDKAGALLVADDVGNTVWRVSSQRQAQR